ncbi:MAG: hypothetical protein M1823_001526 [Watsoniomyces obsoletus]|nr:MAG: hypothetical protein M1823_001526 [Watsoniomyces obsoletus]
MATIDTQVWVDGAWRTQRVNVNTILGRPSGVAPPEQRRMEPEKPAPNLAVMTRTLVGSPVVKWIIPARIRRADRNDVILIGETFVQIKELQPDGRLRDVASKTDFAGNILHARVFGTPRQPASASSTSSEQGSQGYTETDEKIEILTDDGSISTDDQVKLPPHVLVVLLDTSELLFLFANEHHDGTLTFHTCNKASPKGDVNGAQIAKHIAVDPRSRAMAVAVPGPKSTLTLFALQPMARAGETIARNGKLQSQARDFLIQEHHLFVNGEIILMEFLYPAVGDDQHVILLLVVDDYTRLLCYEWDSSQSLETAKKPGNQGHRVLGNDGQPLLLIPLIIPSVFLLVHERIVIGYTGILSGSVDQKFRVPIADVPPGGDGWLQRTPRCTSWARPVRTERHSAQHDALYIAREDGMVHYLEIDRGDSLINTTSAAGALRTYIGTAFASLDLPLKTNDMLIAGGDTSAGGHYFVSQNICGWNSFADELQIRPKAEAPECIDVIPNWTPISDAVVVDPASRPIQDVEDEPDIPETRGRLFACTGTASHGAVTEMRAGLKAWMELVLPYHRGASQMWCIRTPLISGVIMVFAFPLHTEVLHISEDMQSVEQKSDADRWGFEFDAFTVAVASFGSLILQITPRSIVAIRSLVAIDDDHLPETEILAMDESIGEVAFHPDSPSVAMVLRSNQVLYLGYTRFDPMNGLSHASVLQDSDPVLLDAEPVHLSIISVHGRTFVLMGTARATLQIYEESYKNGLKPVLEHAFNEDLSMGDFAICESIACLRCGDKEQESGLCFSLACGLRNGCLVILSIESSSYEDDSMTINSSKTIRIGDASTHIIPDPSFKDRAFLVCGAELCRIRLCSNDGTIQVWNIWLSDHNEPSYKQGPVSVIARIPVRRSHSPQSSIFGAVACVTGDQLVVFGLDEVPKEVPRQMRINGTPRKIIYSPTLDLLVVGYSKLKKAYKGPNSPPRRQAPEIVSALALVDLDQGVIQEADHEIEYKEAKDATPTGPSLKFMEHIRALVDWTCTLGDNTYHFIVVGTELISPRHPTMGGRILLFTIKRLTEGAIKVKPACAMLLRKPISHVATFGAKSLIVASGEEVCLRNLHPEGKKLERISGFKLRSSVVDLSVHGQLVYVSTLSDSLSILRVDDEKLVQVFNDHVARLSDCHLALPELSVVLLADKEYCLSGSWQEPESLTKCSGRRDHSKPLNSRDMARGQTLFEAELPVSIAYLRSGNILPRWRRQYQDVPGVCPIVDHSLNQNPGGGDAAMGVLGFSEDGSIHQFTLLTDAAWQLLSFIQKIALQSTNSPLSGRSGNSRTFFPLRTINPRAKQIDGDLMSQVLGLGSTGLREMLKKGSTKNSNDANAGSVRNLESRMSVLITQLYGDAEGDPVEVVLWYLRALLGPDL